MGRVISLKQLVPVAPQNGPRSNKNFFEKTTSTALLNNSLGLQVKVIFHCSDADFRGPRQK